MCGPANRPVRLAEWTLPIPPALRAGLRSVADRAADFLDSLPTRHACGTATPEELIRALDRPLPEHGAPADQVIRELAADGGARHWWRAPGPRFFGFVIGGLTYPVAPAAPHRLTSAWDQNAGLREVTPAHSAAARGGGRGPLVHRPAGAIWRNHHGHRDRRPDGELPLGPAAGRHAVLARAGWDVEAQRLAGRATGAGPGRRRARHDTVDLALRYLGLGAPAVGRCRRAGARHQRCAGCAGSRGAGNGRRPDDRRAAGWSTSIPDSHRRLSPPPSRWPTNTAAWVHIDGAFSGLGGGLPTDPASSLTGHELCRLLGHRRAQDTERPVRLGPRDRARTRRGTAASRRTAAPTPGRNRRIGGTARRGLPRIHGGPGPSCSTPCFGSWDDPASARSSSGAARWRGSSRWKRRGSRARGC